MVASKPRKLLRQASALLYLLRVLLWIILFLPVALFWLRWESVVIAWMVVCSIALLVHLRRKSLLHRLDIDERYLNT